MSQTLATANEGLTTAVTRMSADMTAFAADLNTGLADLKQRIDAGHTIAAADLAPILAAAAAIDTIDQGLASASTALRTAVGTPGGGATAGGAASGGVTFNPADATPNTPGGRNSPSLPDFNPSQPATA